MYAEKIIIKKPNESPIWIKDIDRKHKTLTFTDNPNDAYIKEIGGIFVEEEIKYLKFHFINKYPELKYAKPYDDEQT